jgi:hypothetical protein
VGQDRSSHEEAWGGQRSLERSIGAQSFDGNQEFGRLPDKPLVDIGTLAFGSNESLEIADEPSAGAVSGSLALHSDVCTKPNGNTSVEQLLKRGDT